MPRLSARADVIKSLGHEPRRIGTHHFAFLRAYLSGLGLIEPANPYLNIGRDGRKAFTAQRWLLAALRDAAIARNDFSTARLLAIPPGALSPLFRGTQLSELDPASEYLGSAIDRVGGAESAETISRRDSRNTRLRNKQLMALAHLESRLVEYPRPEHHVASWFDDETANNLIGVGIVTLDQLIETISEQGRRWYRQVPQIGQQTAGRITAWLDANAWTLGRRPAPIRSDESGAPLHDLQGGRLPSTSIAPLEYFKLPDDTEGTEGCRSSMPLSGQSSHRRTMNVELPGFRSAELLFTWALRNLPWKLLDQFQDSNIDPIPYRNSREGVVFKYHNGLR